MKKHFTIFLLGLSMVAQGQLKIIAESPVFEEPESGQVLLTQLKDGASAYIHLTPKAGLNLRSFDATHKQTLVTTLEPDYGKLKGMQFKGVYDINNELTLFISEVEGGVPSLYRLRLDKQSGNLKELKTLATLKKTNLGQGYAGVVGNVPMPDFLVAKDLSSDHYAVARFNSFESERAKRVEIIQYAPDGSEKSKVFLSSPGDKYKFTEIYDVALEGEVAYALLFSYNTPSSGGAENELLLATVRNGEVTYTNIGKAIKRRISSASLHKNPTTGNLIFVVLERLKTRLNGWASFREEYAVSINNLDLKTGAVTQAAELQTKSLMPKYRKLFKTDDKMELGYDALVQNGDGSFTVKLEHVETITSTVGGMSGPSPGRVRTRVVLGSSGILTYDTDGKEIANALIPKSQSLATSMGASGPVPGSSVMNAGNQFKGTYFVKMKNKSYAFINDIADNAERIEKGKLTDIKSVGECDAWQYDLTTQVSPALPMPQRTLLFPPADRKEKNLVLVGISSLDWERNKLMTIKVNKKGASVVWMTE